MLFAESFRFPVQFLESAGLHTFVGGNLGTPFSEAALACLAARPGSCPYQAWTLTQLFLLHLVALLPPRQSPRFSHTSAVQAAVVEVSSYQMELPGLFKPKVCRGPGSILASIRSQSALPELHALLPKQQ